MKTTGTIFGHPATALYGAGEDGLTRWDDTNEVVPRDEEGNAQPDADHPCPQCGDLPGPSGHDPCIDQLEGVEFACCGHGIPADAYVAFDENEDGSRKVIRSEEAYEYFRLVR
jgi:hypothetical protein